MSFTPSTDQQAIIDSVLQNSFTAVSAGAGTGKTFTTVETVVRLLKDKETTGDKFALITFTNKAATELRERLQERFMELVQTSTHTDEKRWWLEQLELLQLSFVGTIHAFCRQILLLDGYRKNLGINVNHSPNMRMDLFDLQQMAYEVLDHAVDNDRTRFDGLIFSQDTENGLRKPDIKDFTIVQALTDALVILRGSGKSVDEYIQLARKRKPLDGWVPIDKTGMSEEEANEAEKEDTENKKRSKENWERRQFMFDLLEKVNQRYIEHKQDEKIIDQEDLLILTHTVLSNDDTLQQSVADRYPNLFVDEFQDTDQTQKMIVDTLFPIAHAKSSSTKHRVLVVGDRKQSIYGFRGADVELLQQFAKERNIDLKPLTESRRPTPDLAAKFERLFSKINEQCFNNSPTGDFAGPDAKLKSTRNLQKYPPVTKDTSFVAPVYVSNVKRDAQIERIIKDIKDLKSEGIHLEDMAILLRSNKQVADIMAHPFFKSHGESNSQGTFWSRPEILDTLSVLRWVEHGDAKTIVHVALRSLWFHRILDNAFITNVSNLNLINNEDITEFIAQLRHQQTHKSALHILKKLFQFSDVWDSLSEQQQQNLKHLYALANDIYKNGDALTLSEFVKWFEHKVLTEQEEQDSAERLGLGNGDRIQVMTIHQAKGLEFPIVFMPFMERSLKGDHYNPTVLIHDTIGIDFNFDKVKALDFETYAQQIDRLRLEEELRILYVGVTRTKDQLYLYGETRGDGSIDGVHWSWWNEILAATL